MCHRNVAIVVTAALLGASLCSAQGSQQQQKQQGRQGTASAAFEQGIHTHRRALSATAVPKFVPINLNGPSAIENGTSIVWQETDWTIPDDNDRSTKATDWEIYRLQVKGQKLDWQGTKSWVTKCGYLRWDMRLKKIQYDAEVDGCQDTWRFYARLKADNSAVQTGVVKVTVAVDNCVYGSCEHPGCEGCRCNNKTLGTCSCGGGKLGFTAVYNWEDNKHMCSYVPLTSVTDESSTPGLFEVPEGATKIWVPFTFSGMRDTRCLPGAAADALRADKLECKRTAVRPNKKRATAASRYPGQRPAGYIDPICNESDGIYKVVVDVPPLTGQYQCYITLNDGLNDRLLAELRVNR